VPRLFFAWNACFTHFLSVASITLHANPPFHPQEKRKQSQSLLTQASRISSLVLGLLPLPFSLGDYATTYCGVPSISIRNGCKNGVLFSSWMFSFPCQVFAGHASADAFRAPFGAWRLSEKSLPANGRCGMLLLCVLNTLVAHWARFCAVRILAMRNCLVSLELGLVKPS